MSYPVNRSIGTGNVIALLKTPALARVISNKTVSQTIEFARENQWVLFDNKGDTFLSFTHECLGYSEGSAGKEIKIDVELIDPLETFESNLLALPLKSLLGSNKKVAEEYYRLTELLDKSEYKLTDEVKKVSNELKKTNYAISKIQNDLEAFSRKKQFKDSTNQFGKDINLLDILPAYEMLEKQETEKTQKELQNLANTRDTLRERLIQEVAKSAEGYREKLRNQIKDLKRDIQPEVYFYYGVGDNPDAWAGPVYGQLKGVQYIYNGDGGIRVLKVSYTALDTGTFTSSQEKIIIKGMGRTITASYPLKKSLHTTVTGVITDYLSKSLSVPERNVLVLLPDVDNAKREQIEVNKKTIKNTKPNVLIDFQERLMTLGQMNLSVGYGDMVLQDYIDRNLQAQAKKLVFGTDKTGSFEEFMGTSFYYTANALNDFLKPLDFGLTENGPIIALLPDETGALTKTLTNKSSGANFINDYNEALRDHMLSSIVLDDSMFLATVNPHLQTAISKSVVTFTLNETETFLDGLGKIELGLKTNSDESLESFDLFYESDVEIVKLIEKTLQRYISPNFEFDQTSPLVIYGESRFLTNWFYATQFTGTEKSNEDIVAQNLGRLFNTDTVWMTDNNYREEMRSIVLDLRTEEDTYDNLVYSLPDEYAYQDPDGQIVDNPKKNLRIPVFKHGVKNSNILGIDVDIEGTYFNFLNGAITPTLLDMESPYSVAAGDVVSGLQELMKGKEYTVDNIEYRIKDYIGQANKYSPHEIARYATEIQADFGQVPEGFESEVSESLLFQMVMNTVGDKPVGISYKTNELIKSSVLKRQLELFNKLNRVPFTANIKTVPFFKIYKMAHVMNYPVYLIINEAKVYDQTYNKPMNSIQSRMFSGVWNIVGFKHTITPDEIHSSFSLTKNADMKPAPYVLAKVKNNESEELEGL